MISVCRWFAFILLLLPAYSANLSPDALRLQIINKSGYQLEVFWVNTLDSDHFGELEPQLTAPMRNGTKTFVITYRNHKFRVRIPSTAKNVGIDAPIDADYTMGPREATIFVYFENGLIVLQESTAFTEQLDDVKKSLEQCGRPGKDGYVECIAAPITEKIVAAEERNKVVVESFASMVERYRNYTCADETLETSTPIATDYIRIGRDELPVNILLDTSHAKIWYVDNFILPSECDTLMQHGQSRLERATVYEETNGSFILSNKRKAQQATYKISGPEDPMAPFYHRLFGAINQRTNYNLRPDGQQGIALIQYNPGDEYAPHCDGACDGSDHITAGRVATAVCYCEVPKRGGATTFSKARVHVKPKVGTAVFFTYLGDDGKMDRGLTDHSGCPVLEGEKWLATMWFRKGVTAEKPSHLFDATGTLKSGGPS